MSTFNIVITSYYSIETILKLKSVSKFSMHENFEAIIKFRLFKEFSYKGFNVGTVLKM